MDENILALIHDRRALLCLFKEGYLMEMHQEDINIENEEKDDPDMQGYALYQLNDVLWRITNYLGMSYYPPRYISMLYNQLDGLIDIEDFRMRDRRKIVNETKGRLNLCINNGDYFKGFLVALFGDIMEEINELNYDEETKKAKMDILQRGIDKLAEIDKEDDPDDDMKNQIYTDMYNALMPTVDEGVQMADDDPNIDLLCYLSDTPDLIDEFNDNGFAFYESQFNIRGFEYDPITMDNLQDYIDSILKWVELEKEILLTHVHLNFFEENPSFVPKFVKTDGYYKAIQNIFLEYNSMLQKSAFIDNILYIFSLRDEVGNALRRELSLLMRLTREDCFDGEGEQLARDYSSEKEFYEYLQRLFVNYKTLGDNEVFLQNVRHVVLLNEKCAKKSLKKAYNELMDIFKELDKKG